MRHTVDRMLSKPSDYKICMECGTWNWYENDECIRCGHSKFRKTNSRDTDAFREILKDYGNIELDV